MPWLSPAAHHLNPGHRPTAGENVKNDWRTWLAVAIGAIALAAAWWWTNLPPTTEPVEARPPLPARVRPAGTAAQPSGSELDLLPESVVAAGRFPGPGSSATPGLVTPPALGDLRVARSFELEPWFVAQVKRVVQAGVDPVLVAHAVARQFNRQSEALLLAGENVDFTEHEKQAAVRRQEWLVRLVGEPAYRQWLAESEGTAPRAPATAVLPVELVGRVRQLQADGVDAALLAHLVLSQQGRQEQAGGNFAGQDAVTATLGAEARERWETQETFRRLATPVSALTDEQLLGFSKVFREFRQQLARGGDFAAARRQYEAAKVQLLGGELARQLP